MLKTFGDFLGTPTGFWATMVVTAITVALCYFSTDIATYVLSVIAIIIPAIILVRDAAQQQIAQKRDEAMHRKLDELIHAADKADDRLEGIEKE